MPGVRIGCGLGVTWTQTFVLLLTYLKGPLRIAGSACFVRQLVLLVCFAPLPGRINWSGAVHQGLAIDHSGTFIRRTQV